ncbi:MAG TPA: hypothetical protein VGC24_08210, partial [Burkholderiaceae bacterium]
MLQLQMAWMAMIQGCVAPSLTQCGIERHLQQVQRDAEQFFRSPIGSVCRIMRFGQPVVMRRMRMEMLLGHGRVHTNMPERAIEWSLRLQHGVVMGLTQCCTSAERKCFIGRHYPGAPIAMRETLQLVERTHPWPLRIGHCPL